MDVLTTDGALGRKILEITVPAEEWSREQNRVILDFKKEVKIPGFRPGKVPISIIKSRFPEQIKSQLIRRVIPTFYERALTETGLEPIGQPEFDYGELSENGPFTFKATVEILPEVKVDNYRGMEIIRATREVTDRDVEAALEQLRGEQASLVPVDREAREGDFVSLALTVLDRTGVQLIGEKTQEVTYALGSAVLGDAFDRALVGASVDRELNIVSTPSRDFERRDLAGRETRFKAKVREIAERRLPALDDEFARDVNDRFKSLAELRDYIRKSLEEREEERAEAEARRQIINGLIDRNPFDPPESMVNRFLGDLLGNYKSQHENPDIVDEELFAREHRATAVREIKSYLLLDALAKKENLEVSEEEVDRRISQLAEAAGMPPAKYRAGLLRSKQFNSFVERLKEKRIFDFLRDQCKIRVEKA